MIGENAEGHESQCIFYHGYFFIPGVSRVVSRGQLNSRVFYGFAGFQR